MADAIREHHPGVEISLQPSSGGRFEVTVDGVAVFEKSVLGRHALPGEILTLIQQAAR